jgi:hypothetical protein
MRAFALAKRRSHRTPGAGALLGRFAGEQSAPPTGRGHAAEPQSSGCAASSLRSDPFGMTASRRRGILPTCPFGDDRGQTAASLTKGTCRPTAIDARSGQDARAKRAPAKRLGLDGEHGGGPRNNRHGRNYPAPAFSCSLPRRACAATKASAAGVMPSMRPAWPILFGRIVRNFCRNSLERPDMPA